MKQLPGQQRDTLTQHNMQHVKRHTYKKKKICLNINACSSIPEKNITMKANACVSLAKWLISLTLAS